MSSCRVRFEGPAGELEIQKAVVQELGSEELGSQQGEPLEVEPDEFVPPETGVSAAGSWKPDSPTFAACIRDIFAIPGLGDLTGFLAFRFAIFFTLDNRSLALAILPLLLGFCCRRALMMPLKFGFECAIGETYPRSPSRLRPARRQGLKMRPRKAIRLFLNPDDAMVDS
ncbi:hypothetical protein PG994_013487 [Apiospora phragmitis]|uniref:Uncharacterized protein n=1 Tax=Apiospora phragmitis TaxID=2905665 RepID=A0ABR1T8R2_9PEZI